MLTVKIEIEAHSLNDVELAIDEAKEGILNGSTSGMDSNDTGNYTFSVDGETEPLTECCNVVLKTVMVGDTSLSEVMACSDCGEQEPETY